MTHFTFSHLVLSAALLASPFAFAESALLQPQTLIVDR